QVARFNDLLAKAVIDLGTDTSPLLLADPAATYDFHTDTYDGTHPNEPAEHRMAAAFAGATWRDWELGGPYEQAEPPGGTARPDGTGSCSPCVSLYRAVAFVRGCDGEERHDDRRRRQDRHGRRRLRASGRVVRAAGADARPRRIQGRDRRGQRLHDTGLRRRHRPDGHRGRSDAAEGSVPPALIPVHGAASRTVGGESWSTRSSDARASRSAGSSSGR